MFRSILARHQRAPAISKPMTSLFGFSSEAATASHSARSMKKLSYLHGTSSTKLEYKTIAQKFRETAEKFPDNPALISHEQNKIMTYQEYYQESQKLAAGLLKLGLKKGDRIGIYSPNNYEWCLTQFAAAMADLILVNINPAYQQHELEYCLNKVGIKALIMASHHRKSNYIQILKNIAPEIETSKFGSLKAAKLPKLKFILRIDDEKSAGFGNFQDLLQLGGSKEMKALDHIIDYASPDDATNIQFTSGTTGTPKAATLTHFNLINNSKFVGQRLDYTHKDRVILPVPLYHCFGMVMGNLSAINFGSTVVLPSEGFSAKRTMEAVTKYKVTSIYGVPSMFIEYIREYESNPSIYDYSSLEKGIMAGSLCPEVLMKKLITDWKISNIQIAYGQTETSPIIFQTVKEDNLTDKTTTVGTIFPHMETKIVNKKGHTVPIGEKGEIYARGYSVMEKYWNDRKATNKTIDEDGWIKTGDMGEIDERGYLKIVGRFKEMIIRGGENIFPKEIEEYLRTHPSIQDAQVVGIEDENFGEETFALIRLKEGQKLTQQDILTFCKGNIAHFKVPKYAKFVEQYQLTVTGKIQKFAMVNDLMKEKHLFESYKVRHY